jgi:hypothetical protein
MLVTAFFAVSKDLLTGNYRRYLQKPLLETIFISKNPFGKFNRTLSKQSYLSWPLLMQHSLMFVGKARSLPKSEVPEKYFTVHLGLR